jgi:hypothetical protein
VQALNVFRLNPNFAAVLHKKELSPTEKLVDFSYSLTEMAKPPKVARWLSNKFSPGGVMRENRLWLLPARAFGQNSATHYYLCT